MKQRLLSILLSLSMVIPMLPTAHAAGSASLEDGFMLEVSTPLPEKQSSGLMEGDYVLPDVDGTDFIGKLTGPMPEIREEDGFLAAPSAPLKAFPEEGKLMAPVGAPKAGSVSIGSVEDLRQMTSGGSYHLTADLDLTAVPEDTVWEIFELVYGISDFVLDGQGHRFIYGGCLFESVHNATFRNLIFVAPDVSGEDSSLTSPILNTSGDLTVENCTAENYHLADCEYRYFSGIVSYHGAAAGDYDSESEGTVTFTDCAVNYSTVSEWGEVGGLIGTVDSAENVRFTDCIVKVDLLVGEDGIGGGLAGTVSCTGEFSALRCSVTGSVTGKLGYAAGMVGYLSCGFGYVTDCAFDGTVVYQTESTDERLSGGAFFPTVYTDTSFVFENCRASGSLSADRLNEDSGLAAFLGRSNSAVVFKRCLADMDITAVSEAEEKYDHRSYAGSLLGLASGSFYAEECVNIGDLTQGEGGKDTAVFGGLLACSRLPSSTQFLRCENRGDVTARSHIGGLVTESGDETSAFSFVDCKNTGTLTCTQPGLSAGGMLGRGVALVRNCVNTGTLSGSTVGGMIGQTTDYGASFTDCRAACTLICPLADRQHYAGGMVGCDDFTSYSDPISTLYTGCAADVEFILSRDVPDEAEYESYYFFTRAGGLSGESAGKVNRCSTRVSFRCPQAYDPDLGGLIGYTNDALTVTNSTAEVLVDGITFSTVATLGGLVGTGHTQLNFDNCAAQVDISAPCTADDINVGGMAGYTTTSVMISNSYVTGSIDMVPEVFGGAHGSAGGLIGAQRYSQLLTLDRCWTDVDISDADYMGGLAGYIDAKFAGISACWADGTLSLADSVDLLPDESNVASNCMGGLVGYDTNTNGVTGSGSSLVMQDCCFVGEVVCADAEYNGGIIGCGGAMIYNCYSTADLAGSDLPVTSNSFNWLGGLAGYVSGIVSNCYYDGTASNPHGYTGGISGGGKVVSCRSAATLSGYDVGGIIGSGTATDCSFYGRISAAGTAGGIVSSGGAENCTSSGVVQGSTVGGIAGSMSESITDCTSDCFLYPREDDSGFSIGGIAGSATYSPGADITNCHYQRHLQITTNTTEDMYVGGIVGAMEGKRWDKAVIADSTCKGVSVYVTALSGTVKVGGIAGAHFTGQMSNCRVDGNVYVRAWGGQAADTTSYEIIKAGGLIGYSGGYTTMILSNCTVNGNISTSLTPSRPDKRYATITDGIYVGDAADVSGENCAFTGIFTPGETFPDDRNTSRPNSLLGYGRWFDQEDVPEIDIPEKPIEGYQVLTKAWTQVGPLETLAGVDVYANGVHVGTSDANGEVVFGSDVYSSTSIVWLSASKEGYFETTHPVYLADGGSFTLVLEKKTPGEIFIKSAIMTDSDTGTSDLLSTFTDLRIPMLDTTSRALTVEIDWNDLDETPRSLMLTDKHFIHTVPLAAEGGTTYVTLPETFDSGEDIYLRAIGVKDGEAVEKTVLLNVRVQATNININTLQGNMDVGGSGDKDDPDYLYFLRGLKIGLDFGDLADLATSISYKNKYITVKFDFEDEEKKEISVWSGFSEKVSVGGELKIPVTQLFEGEWDGKIKVSVNDGVKRDASNKAARKYNEKEDTKEKITFDLYIGGVPCFIETGIDVGGSAEFGVHGKLNDPMVDAKIALNGSGSIFGGIGGEVVKDVEFKFGAEGELTVELPMTFDMAKEDSFSLDPELSGDLSAKVSIKAYILELEEKLRVGGFVWNKNGAVWTWLDEKPEAAGMPVLMSLSSDAGSWKVMDRSYLADGGGFLPYDMSLFAFSGAAGQNLRYENIGDLAETALTTVDGQAVLYYTADDGAAAGGDVTHHTVLYRTVQQPDGSWSDPVAVSSSDDGYPSSPYACGEYVIWTESTEPGTLDDMLQSTRIRIARNGEIVHTIDPGGYAYAPKIAVSDSGVVAAWFRDDSVSSENLLGGDAKVHYAYSFGDSWSNAAVMSRINGTAQVFSLVCGSKTSDSYIYYVNEKGAFYRNPLQKSAELQKSGLSGGRVAMHGKLAAVFGEDGTVKIYYNSSLAAEFPTQYNGTVQPVFAYDGSNYALFWPEEGGICAAYSSGGLTWSESVLIAPLDGSISELSATLVDGDPFITYTCTTDGRTDLYTATVPADSADLVMLELGYDKRDIVERGYIVYQGSFFNNGLAAADGFTLSVTDENGAEVYTRTYSDPAVPGETVNFTAAFAPDGLREHTYTFRIQPVVGTETVVDADASDNALSVVVGAPSAKILDAGFSQLPEGGVSLSASVQNTGASLLDGVCVEVSDANGSIIFSRAYSGEDAIPSASIRQIQADGVLPGTAYTVTVRCGDTVLDSRSLLYEDPNAKMLLVQGVSGSGDTAQVALYGQNCDAPGMLVLAVYEGERMAAVGVRSVADFNGERQLTLTLSDTLAAGDYRCKVFFLADDGSYLPLSEAVPGTMTVSG